MSKVYIIHDVDGKIYFEFLERFYDVEYLYSRSLRFFIADIIKRKVLSVDKLKSFFKILFLLISAKNETLIIAIAPGSIKFLLLERLFRRNRIIYHTSWHKYEPYSPRFNYGIFNNILKKKWLRLITKGKANIVTVTNKGKVKLSQIFPANKIMVIEHPTKLDPLSIDEINNKYTNSIIYLGRLVPEKGVDLIVRLAENLPKKFKLQVAGLGPLSVIIKEHRNIKYLGYLEKEPLKVVLSKSNFLILPSLKTNYWEELFGMSIVEAMSQGVIPICTNHTGPKSIITDKVNGFLFKEEDFLEGTLELITNLTEDQIKNLQINCILSSSNYSIQSISKKWKRLIG